MPKPAVFPVALVLNQGDYEVLTGALMEYADEMLLRANEGGPNVSRFHDNAARAHRLARTVEQARAEP